MRWLLENEPFLFVGTMALLVVLGLMVVSIYLAARNR
jgi:hypothetical protein